MEEEGDGEVQRKVVRWLKEDIEREALSESV